MTEPPKVGDPPSGLIHPVLRRLHAYWDRKRAGRIGPTRGDIDPAEFPYAVGWASLFDVRQGADKFSIRVLGGQTESVLDLGPGFRRIEDVQDPEFHAVAHRDLCWVIENRRPLRSLHDFTTRHRHYRFEGVMLPISDDGHRVSMVLVAAIPPIGG